MPAIASNLRNFSSRFVNFALGVSVSGPCKKQSKQNLGVQPLAI